MTEEKEKTTTHKGVSRRQFIAGTVGGVVVGAAAGAVAGSLGFPKTITEQPWMPSSWDYTADVVVVGYGFAGAAAAITAADSGASVIILEKQAQDKHTANSQMCLGVFVSPTNAADALTYMSALSRINLDIPESQDMDNDVIQAWATSMSQNKAWLTQLGISKFAFYATTGLQPEVPGNSSIQALMMAKPDGTTGVGLDLFNFLAGVVGTKSQVKVMWGTPATSLVQNAETKEILGVKATSNGTTVNIKANKSVILTTGGYEFDDEAVKTFSQVYPIVFYGNPDNTGDGVRMAEAAGAALSHMTMLGGGLKARFKDFETGFLEAVNPKYGYIYVDKTGNRFANEDNLGGYTGYWNTIYMDVSTCKIPRVPCYWIFDSNTIKAGPVVYTSFGAAGPIGLYKWSQDNSAEIAKGWILQGDTLEDLATAINNSQSGSNTSQLWTIDATIDPATLSATVARYNSFCATKSDTDFGRSASELVPIQSPPYYAMILWPGMNNTFGGPRRNAKAQIVGLDGNPIPRLYSAGELGSVYVHYPQGGANVGECFAFGRIAGQNAAAETPWS